MKSDFYITHLYVYPIKGLSGLTLKTAEVTERGLKYDRRWMLVDEHHKFISQRTFPELCFFKITMDENGFIVHYKNERLAIPFEWHEGFKIKVEIWDDKVDAIEASAEMNAFFSDILKIKCKIVYMPDSSKRWVDKFYVESEYPVSFADGYPILLIGQESLHQLNKKLEEPISINRFRPNIVFSGGEAHIEDSWSKIGINNVELKGVKPCGRCTVITINQESAETSKEPLKTLATYRNFNNKINFGQNIIVLKEGKIGVGDLIKIF